MYQHLRTLTHKNTKFEWTIECQKAFDTIHTPLREDSFNAYFDPNPETKVIVDGSKKDGVASTLTQKDPGTDFWRVVRYDSRPVIPQENTTVRLK